MGSLALGSKSNSIAAKVLVVKQMTTKCKYNTMLMRWLITLFAKYAPLITTAATPNIETPKILLTTNKER